jgi:hypothetical protein
VSTDDLDEAAARAADMREGAIRLSLALDPPSAWYMAEGSECRDCPHGPRWHADPSGCLRMVDDWCECELVYLPGATGPDDFIAE